LALNTEQLRISKVWWLKQAWYWHWQTVYSMARNLACQWGKNSWSVEMRGMPVRWN